MLDHPNNLKKFVCYFSFLTYYVCVRIESDRCTESDTVVLECVCVRMDRCLHDSVFFF